MATNVQDEKLSEKYTHHSPDPSFVIDSEEQNKQKAKKQDSNVSIIQLFRFANRKERMLIALAILLSMISGVLSPISISFYGKFLSQVITVPSKDNLLHEIKPIILAITYTAIGILLSTYVSNQLWIRTGASQAHRIRNLYLCAILNQEMGWFDQRQNDSLTSRLTEDTRIIEDGISENVGLCLIYFSQFVAGLVISFTKDYQMTLILLAVLPILFIVVNQSTAIVKKYMGPTLKASSDANATAEQSFRSIRTVHTFSLQKRFVNLYEKKSDQLKSFWIKIRLVSSMTPGIYMLFFFSFAGIALRHGFHELADHKLDAPSMYVTLVLMSMGSGAISRMLTIVWSTFSACSAAANVYAVIDEAPLINSESEDGKKLSSPQGNFEFNHVSFMYPSRLDTPILRNVTFEIKKGTTVAFVGPSGSGKSTIIQLLQRFYDPTSGSITMDGHPLNTLDLKWLRASMGIVGQQPVLFDTTIRKNIALGTDREVTDEEIVQACKEANCHQFIRQLPNGYDTVVGDSGAMLSGGQKQRIAIARALIRNPSILLLDEATSALDTKSERLVQHALDKASATRTTIMIAHRLSTIVKADMIFVVDKGQIIEQGTHQALIDLEGMYAQLVSKQKIEAMDEQEAQSLMEEEIEDAQSSHYTSDDKSSTHGKQHYRMMRMLTEDSDGSKSTSKSQKVVSNHNTPIEDKSPVSSWQLFKELKPEWKTLAVGAVGTILLSVAMPFYSFSFSTVIGILGVTDTAEVQLSSGIQGINLVALLMFFCGLASLIGSWLGSYYFWISVERFAHRLRVRVFSSLLKQEIAYFDAQENNAGILISKLASETSKVSLMIVDVWGKLVEVAGCSIFGIVLACLYSWQITLACLALVPFIFLASFFEIRIQSKYVTQSKEMLHESSRVANEAIREIRTVISLSKQAYFKDLYQKSLIVPYNLTIKKSNVSSLGIALNRSIMVITRIIIYVVGSILIMHGYIDFSQFFTSMTVLLMTVESIGDKVMVGSVYAQGMTAASNIFDIINRHPAIDSDLEGLETPIQGDIDIKRIRFSYPTRPERPIFHGKFKFSATAGQSIALVGASGCGKSTIIGLLLRWYDAQHGTVAVDGTDVKNYSVRHLRKHMAVVSQEPVLFDMTVGENLRFGSEEDITQEAMEAACKSANIHTFITSLPNGYDTRVGDKGSQLSGGQRQRIAIARALIRDPKILMLDEATSALDSESEQLVQEALDNIISEGKRTIITIAHRLSTITRSDVICVVENGEIIEQGCHQELLSRDSVYAKLVQEQSLNS